MSSELSEYSPSGCCKEGNKTKPPSNESQRDVMKIVLFFTTVALSCLLVYRSPSNPLMFLPPWKTNWFSQNQTFFELREPDSELERVLMNAAMEDKTVIITALNKAWVAPNSIFDLFLESFRIGIGTKRLLKHVVGVCMDKEAYDRCLQIHPHCYFINATGSDKLAGQNDYLSPSYLALIWRRMNLLRQVLTLGYNFIFTDADILWFRDPFPRFFLDADFQIACDHYNRKPSDKNNWVNSGFTYVKANNKTQKFYDYWCRSGRKFRGRKHDQDIFNFIKKHRFVAKTGIKMRFLDTVYFGGFCQPSKDVNVVNTMHANCCVGLNNKIRYLKTLLRDWKRYLSANLSGDTTPAETKWNLPHRCHRCWR